VPELPEIAVIARQMNDELRDKCINEVEARQPKNLNVPVVKFCKTIKGKTVDSVMSRGKWLFMKLEPAHFLLINLGMGAELLHFSSGQKLPDNYHFRLEFSDKTGFTIHFWWFGYVHLLPEKEMPNHKMTASLGLSPLHENFTIEHFRRLVSGRKTTLKSLLLDQKNVAGIGNVYAQDILFKARLHPNRKASTLTEKEADGLYRAMRQVLNSSVQLSGAAFERDFFGQRGGFTSDHFLVGYKAGKPCPECGTTIEKIRTGSTSSYVCPKCQPLE
jgi:formamidopyrimidine-DNA glycosylase